VFELKRRAPLEAVDADRRHTARTALVEPDRDVEILGMQDGMAIIGGGISDGERVVVDGQYRLTNGARVKVDEDRPAAPAPTKMRWSERRSRKYCPTFENTPEPSWAYPASMPMAMRAAWVPETPPCPAINWPMYPSGACR
jgi:hypothetical protein